MRIEQDAGGLSVFLSTLPDVRVALAYLVVGLLALVPGLVLTALRFPLLGPSLVFLGLGWYLTAHWLTAFSREVPCDHLRIDHLGVRAGHTRLMPDAVLEEGWRGLRITADRVYLIAIPEGAERQQLKALITTGLKCNRQRWESGAGAIPGEIRALVPPVAGRLSRPT